MPREGEVKYVCQGKGGRLAGDDDDDGGGDGGGGGGGSSGVKKGSVPCLLFPSFCREELKYYRR